jgi:molybdate transport system substrate-binding protein
MPGEQMRYLTMLLIFSALWLASSLCVAATLRVAAAADLKFCMDEIVNEFRKLDADADIEVIYGSSGNFKTQIQQGAPFDLYFSADIAFPRELVKEGLAASDVQPYALGRIVLWSPTLDASRMNLGDLGDPAIRKIAIANPRHAPYGMRAEEALRAAGIWRQVEHRLVYGENIAQTAQFVESGNAQIGIIALSLALSPELAARGGYALIPDDLHEPLEQGFIITARASGNALAKAFATHMGSRTTRAIMIRYGFVLPGEVPRGLP